MYRYEPYPKWIHHRDLGSKIVKTKEEHEAHGDEWVESIHDIHLPFENDGDESHEPDPHVGEDGLPSVLVAARKRGRPRKVQE